MDYVFAGDTTKSIRQLNGFVQKGGDYSSDYSEYSLFVIKEGEDRLFWLATPQALLSRNFKKAALEYFQDCPVLIEKLNSGEFKRRNAAEMVQFYNNECQ